jgi:hypothetical protein
MSAVAKLVPIAKTLALPLLGVAVAALMARDVRLHPYNPLQAYGQNGPDSLKEGLQLLVAEMLVALVILRPWSYRASWGRAAVAGVLCAPWTLTLAAMGMHAGSMYGIHLLWLLALNAILAVCFLWSAIVWGRQAPEASS